ncbi:MAG: M28 family peptidase [Gemmatimonadaceae bacterium]
MLKAAFRRNHLAITAATTATLALFVSSANAQDKAATTKLPPAKPTAAKVVWPDEGPRTWAPRPTETAITANDLRTRLYGFADDSMAGRKIGEPGNYKGTEYIAREFKRMGLKPAGENGGYFQDLPYGPINYDSSTTKLSIGGSALMAKKDWIPTAPTATNKLSAKASFSDVPTVFAGQWGDTTPLDPAIFKGKIAVFLGPPPATPRGPARILSCDSVPNKFGAANAAAVEQAVKDAQAASGGRGGRGGGRGGTGGGRGGAVADTRAAAAGAVGVLVVGLEDIPAATVAGLYSGRMGMQPAAPSGNDISGATVSEAAGTKLFGKPADQVAVGTAGLPVSGNWTYEWHMSRTPARNVIAVLPGSDPTMAAEYVLVGAHNDHVGTNVASVDHDSLRAVNIVTRPQGNNDPACRPTLAQQHTIDSLIKRARSIRPARRDSIMNGADDDGSGTVVMLEIAEKFAKEKPKRSIIFVSHEGEEAGLLGSKYFTDHPTVPLTSIVAAHNMDMLGKGRSDQVKFGGPTSVQTLGSRRLSREFGDIIDSVNATRTETMAIDKSWDVVANPMNRFCRSDQVNYVLHNVPVTYFSLGYAEDYHQPTDEPQYIEYDHAARLARFIHDIMFTIANRKDKPAISGADPAYPSCGR